MQEFLREYGIYLVWIMGMIFFGLRMFRKKKFVAKNPKTEKKKANILINDWFSLVDDLRHKDTLTEEEKAEIYVLQSKADNFMESHKKLALFFEDEDIAEVFQKLGIDHEPSYGEFLKVSGIENAETVSHFYREKIDEWVESTYFPPYFPLYLYWEIIKGNYYRYIEQKEYSEADPDFSRIRDFVMITNLQLDDSGE